MHRGPSPLLPHHGQCDPKPPIAPDQAPDVSACVCKRKAAGGARGSPGRPLDDLFRRAKPIEMNLGPRAARRNRGSVTSEVVCVAPTGDVCGEGVVWNAAHAEAYWTDINRFLIHRYTPADQCVRTWFFDEPVIALSRTTAPGYKLKIFKRASSL